MLHNICTLYHTLAAPYQYPICTSSITCIILYLYPVPYPVCALPVAYVYPTIPYLYLTHDLYYTVYLYPVPYPISTLPEDSLIPNDSTTLMPMLARYSSTSGEMGAAPNSSV